MPGGNSKPTFLGMNCDDECSTTVELSSIDDDECVVLSDDDSNVESKYMWCDWRSFKEFLLNEYLYGKIDSYHYFKGEKKCWRIKFI